jgi:hypothetical protein
VVPSLILYDQDLSYHYCAGRIARDESMSLYSKNRIIWTLFPVLINPYFKTNHVLLFFVFFLKTGTLLLTCLTSLYGRDAGQEGNQGASAPLGKNGSVLI